MRNSSKPSIAIVGAGPAGLTAAVILHRGGHDVRVYESDLSETYRMQGGSLDLHEDKGQVALRRAGLLEDFRAIARHEDQAQKNIDPLVGIKIKDQGRQDEGLDRPEVDRGELRKLLIGALPTGTVRWDSRLTTILAGTDHAHAMRLSDGTSVEADVVIGADGAWSRVRSSLTSTVPIYTGITFFEGWIDHPTVETADLVGFGSMFAFGGAEAIFAQRNGQGRICVYAALKRPQEWSAKKVPNQVLEACYRQWAPNLRQLLHACPDFTARPIHALPADFSWASRPGITLIGDAAHVMPPVGLGVNLAMLDAADIATALCRGADWADALKQAEMQISQRARSLMGSAIEGFQQWFAKSPKSRLHG